MRSLIIAALAAFLIISACTPQPSVPSGVNTAPSTSPPATDIGNQAAAEQDFNDDMMTDDTVSFSEADISMHITPEDCWIAVNGKVYDITDYIADQKHPGGEALLEGCGKEATMLFETRPMGSGTSHSDKAHKYLEKFYIGELA